MKHYTDIVLNQSGKPIAGATVQVNIHGGGAATIYSDDGVTPVSNPRSCDASGRFDFYVADGRYDLTFTGSGLTTYTLSDIEIADITEKNSGDMGLVATAKNLNNIRFASAFSGSDLGAKINAAFADLGGPGEVWVDSSAGTTMSTAVVIPNNAGLRFTQGGTYTLSAGISGNVGSYVVGAPVATTNGPVLLKQANGANLSSLIALNAGNMVLQDIFVDGNKASNASAGPNIYITGQRAELYRVTSQNSNSHGISLFSSGTSNSTTSAKLFRVVSLSNAGDGIHAVGTADVSVGGGSEIENNAGYGIYLSDSPTWRIEHSDIGGSGLDGLYILGTDSGLQANGQIIVGNQFGNNAHHDIRIAGWGTSGHVSTMNAIVGNSFWVSGTRPDATYDNINITDSAYNTITGNTSRMSASNRVNYVVHFIDSASREVGDLVVGNSMDQSLGSPVVGFLHPAATTLYGLNNDGGFLSSTINKYAGIATVSGGVPAEYATVDLTGQSAAIGTTGLYSVPSAGQYRITGNAKVTTVDAVSSTLGALSISYTDPDGVAVTVVTPGIKADGSIATTSTVNTTSAVLEFIPLVLNCKASTAINYAMAYVSNTPGQMHYNLHLKLEAL